MSAAIFVLTVIFVAYIVYTVVEEDKTTKETNLEQEQAEKVDVPLVAEKATAVKKTAVRPKALRHPETGEKASVPSTYRFAKRWIKDALVSEGLLDKVYKNNELDEKNSAKVKAALIEFKTLEKYHAEK